MTGLVVHEWMEKNGGAEKVVSAMLRAFPGSDLFCLWHDDQEEAKDQRIIESWLSRTFLRNHKALALFAMPPTWRNLRLTQEYEWLLISSHLFAHQARLRGANQDVKKFVYAHTPARYIWTPELDHRGNSLPAKFASSLLRQMDRKLAQQNTQVAANSEFVRKRIANTWGIESRVIYPPVNVDGITSESDWASTLGPEEQRILEKLPENFILGASRFVPYKRLDLVIEAGSHAGLPVVIAGAGPEEQRLRLQAQESKVEVTFVIRPSNAMLYALYQKTTAFIFPAIEDFGIMPVEAMAAGAPVLVNRYGGASESVVDSETGFHLDFSIRETIEAISACEQLEKARIVERSKAFSEKRFETELREWIEE